MLSQTERRSSETPSTGRRRTLENQNAFQQWPYWGPWPQGQQPPYGPWMQQGPWSGRPAGGPPTQPDEQNKGGETAENVKPHENLGAPYGYGSYPWQYGYAGQFAWNPFFAWSYGPNMQPGAPWCAYPSAPVQNYPSAPIQNFEFPWFQNSWGNQGYPYGPTSYPYGPFGYRQHPGFFGRQFGAWASNAAPWGRPFFANTPGYGGWPQPHNTAFWPFQYGYGWPFGQTYAGPNGPTFGPWPHGESNYGNPRWATPYGSYFGSLQTPAYNFPWAWNRGTSPWWGEYQGSPGGEFTTAA